MSDDGVYMGRALELAGRAEGTVSPRPPVGAVIVNGGEVAGEGFTQPAPGPHAEVVALEAAGDRARGATIYVSLEPCSHSSVTEPCADALIQAGVGEVVAGTTDPNPVVNGAGFRKLRAAGVRVRSGVMRKRAKSIIDPFVTWVRTGKPFVTLKMATTLDGKVAALDGTSMWITGGEARAEVHDLRRRADAVLIGSMTVLRDDPLLTCRLDGVSATQPLRVVVDGSGRTPADARVFNADAPTLVITNGDQTEAHVSRWRAAGADVERVPAGENGVDMAAALAVLGRRGVCHVVVEGGPTIAASFVAGGLVDRFVLYLAPKLIGGDAPGLLNDGVKTLTEAWNVRIEGVRRIGDDIRIDARPADLLQER
ncbi:MAG: bifunctional diaminohydroxyphosphoribosylaminopyrimidine deaminase/5-amino-6-(5-phosphoribosylamino)uracil reductase RibD [Actinomycetota bacterium]